MNATLAQQSLEADVFVAMEPMFAEPFWSMAQASIIHFIWLMYARGPRIVGRFFFSGRTYADMCSDINHTVPSSHWSQNETTYQTCVTIIQRDFESWVTCVYVLTLFYLCIWGLKTLAAALLSRPLNHAWDHITAPVKRSMQKSAAEPMEQPTYIVDDGDADAPMWADMIRPARKSPPVVVVSATSDAVPQPPPPEATAEREPNWTGVLAFRGNRMRRRSGRQT